MKPTRRVFLGAGGALATAAAQERGGLSALPLDAVAIARRHPLVRTEPTPDFFEGLLLGNGDIGVCVTVRPDAMGIHIGKNIVETAVAADLCDLQDFVRTLGRLILSRSGQRQ